MSEAAQVIDKRSPSHTIVNPSWLFILWLFGAAWMVLMLLYYPAAFEHADPAVVASAEAFAATMAGVCGGIAMVMVYRWWYHSRLDEEARALLDGKQFPRERLLVITGQLAIIIVTCGIIYWLMGEDSSATTGLASLLGIGGMATIQIFTYSDYRRVMVRARALATEAGREVTFNVGPDRSLCANLLGFLTVIATLGAGAWLQWGVPAAALAEPKAYVKISRPETELVRLTYGLEAGLPAVSPSGTYVAYVQGNTLYKRLWVMWADGGDKWAIPGVKPNTNFPMAWSPDSKRLLVICEESRHTEELAVEQLAVAYDLWVVDVGTGRATKLTDTGNTIAARWVGSDRIAVLRGTKGLGEVWLMNDEGAEMRPVAGLAVPAWPFALQTWHDGKELLVVGLGETAGIWRIDPKDAKATRLSDVPALWAMPLDDKQLVVGTAGKASPPFANATDIGILDTTTGKGRGVIKNLQGNVEFPELIPQKGQLCFVLSYSKNLWTLDPASNKLTKLTDMESVSQPTAAPDGSAIYLTAVGGYRSEKNTQKPGIWRLTMK